MYQCFVLIHTIDHQSSSPSYIINALVGQLLNPSSLNDHIKSIRVVVPKLLPLCLRDFPIQLDVLIGSIDLFCDVHLDTLVSCNNDAEGSVELEQLRENQPRWSSPEKENLDSNWWVELVETVDRASSRVEKGRLFVSEIVNLIQLLLLAGKVELNFGSMRIWRDSLFDILCKSSILSNSANMEILAHERLSATTVETGVALSKS